MADMDMTVTYKCSKKHREKLKKASAMLGLKFSTFSRMATEEKMAQVMRDVAIEETGAG